MKQTLMTWMLTALVAVMPLTGCAGLPAEDQPQQTVSGDLVGGTFSADEVPAYSDAAYCGGP